MTAKDIFRDCSQMNDRINRIEERIERRRALASGCTARPLSADGGSSGSGDASAKMINYVAEITELEAEAGRLRAEREYIRTGCFYLADMLPGLEAGVVLRYYLEGKGIKAIAEEISYSQSQVRRLKGSGDEMLERITVLMWDRVHVPILADAGR